MKTRKTLKINPFLVFTLISLLGAMAFFSESYQWKIKTISVQNTVFEATSSAQCEKSFLLGLFFVFIAVLFAFLGIERK